MLPPTQQQQKVLRLEDLDPEVTEAVWQQFNEVVGKVDEAGKLGVVLFQFHLTFYPSATNRDFIKWCRDHLLPGAKMAIEFRNRSWLQGAEGSVTLQLLADCKIVLVTVDELKHELYQKDREQRGPAPGETVVRLPLVSHDVLSDYGYIRIHRRHGSQKILPEPQLEDLAKTIEEKATRVTGPIYVMWSTDYEDQPIINYNHLTARLGKQLVAPWKERFSHAHFFGGAQARAGSSPALPSSASSSSPSKTEQTLGQTVPTTPTTPNKRPQPEDPGSNKKSKTIADFFGKPSGDKK